MNFVWNTFIYGIIIGIIHYIIMGILYMNPIVGKLFDEAQKNHPGVKMRNSTSDYLTKQFIGTQIEIWIITAGYLFIKNYLPYSPFDNALLIALVFSGIRIYERTWNMYIQTTYPGKLLVIEFVNGTIGTFLIVLGLYFITSS